MKVTKYNTRRPALWNPFFDDFFTRDLFHAAATPGANTSHRFATNIRETETAFELELAAPGFGKDAFNIELNDSKLTVSAKREAANDKQENKYYRKEFGTASLKRTFSVPDTVSEMDVKARFENGVLYISLPKKEETVAPKRHIEVG